MKGRIISIANQKGGVGKTTSCINLAAAMAHWNKKRRILMIDLDPQGNGSTGFGIKKNDREKNIYDVLSGRIAIEDAITKTMIQNLDIITATIDLAAAEFELQKMQNWQYILKNYLARIIDKYAYILIDCPPSLGLLTINSLVASNSIIIPLQCEFFALEGLSHLFNTIEKIKAHLNSNLQIEGVLLTMYDKRNRLTRLIEADVRGNIGEIVYKTIIPRNVALSEASSHGQPILVYNEHSLGAKAYLDLAREIYEKHRVDIEEDESSEDMLRNIVSRKDNINASNPIDIFVAQNE
jgi:chromosome partitioning protein